MLLLEWLEKQGEPPGATGAPDAQSGSAQQSSMQRAMVSFLQDKVRDQRDGMQRWIRQGTAISIGP